MRLWLTDASFHEVVIDFLARVLRAGGLDDVDVLPTHRLLDLAARLSDRELGQDAIARRHAEGVADIGDQLGVGVAPQDDEISDHIWDGLDCSFGIVVVVVVVALCSV